MRTPRRRRVNRGLPPTLLLCAAAVYGCGENVVLTSGSTTGYPAAPTSIAQELPDTPAPLEELGVNPMPGGSSTPSEHAPDSDDPASQDEVEPGDGDPSAAGPEETQKIALRDDNAPPAETRSNGWTSFRNGPQLRGIADSDLPEDPELLWEVTTTDGTRSTAAILEGRVYIGTLGGYVLCLSLDDGAEIWRYRSIESEDPDEFAPGFNAPTTVSAEAVFIGDEDGVFHAIDRQTGEQLWTFPTQGQIVGGATLLPEERVMFGSHDGRLYCLATGTGDDVWQFDTLGPINGSQAVTPGDGEGTDTGTGGAARVNGSQPVAGRYTFVTGCDKPVLRIVDTAVGEEVTDVPLESLLIASPALAGDVLYFGTDSGEVIALNWRRQSMDWVYQDPVRTHQIHSSPAVTEEVVLIGSRDQHLHCIDRATGERRWAFETRGMIDGSPVVVGERVFFGSADRNLYGVNIADGSEAWQYPAGQRITGSPAVAEGRLVIAADAPQGKIFCFGAK